MAYLSYGTIVMGTTCLVYGRLKQNHLCPLRTQKPSGPTSMLFIWCPGIEPVMTHGSSVFVEGEVTDMYRLLVNCSKK